MPSWVNKFQKHEIWPVIEGLRTELNTMRAPEDGDARDTVELVGALADRLAAYRTSVDPLLLTPARLTATQAQLRVLTEAFITWKGSADLSEDYETVDDAAYATIDTMATWPPLVAEQEAEVVSTALARVSEATDQAFSEIAKTQKQVSDTIDQQASTLAQIRTDSEELAKTNETVLSGLEASWKSAQQQQSNRGYAAVKALEDLREEARAMVHDSTSLMVGADYAKQAEERRKSARVYDGAAVLFGALGVIALLYFIHESGDKASDISVGYAITRLGITLGALIIGGFLAARGADEHKEATELQRTALALSRMAPFVANLDHDAREVLTVETADRIFTRGELGGASEREDSLSRLQQLREKRAQKNAEEEAAKKAAAEEE